MKFVKPLKLKFNFTDVSRFHACKDALYRETVVTYFLNIFMFVLGFSANSGDNASQ